MKASPAPTVVIQGNQPSQGIAAVLSLVLPGAGQMYLGYVGTGLALFFVTVIGYAFFILPGLVFHVLTIILAATSPPAGTLSKETPTAAQPVRVAAPRQPPPPPGISPLKAGGILVAVVTVVLLLMYILLRSVVFPGAR